MVKPVFAGCVSDSYLNALTLSIIETKVQLDSFWLTCKQLYCIKRKNKAKLRESKEDRWSMIKKVNEVSPQSMKWSTNVIKA